MKSINVSKKVIMIGAGVLLAVIGSCSMEHSVPAGKVGVQSTMGDIHADVLQPGIHFVAPWIAVSDFDVRLQSIKVEKAAAQTHDQQPVGESLTVNYEYDKKRVVYLRNNFGNDDVIAEQYIQPAILEAFKSVTAQYTSSELTEKRDEVSAKTVAAIQAKVAKYGVIVSDVNVADFHFADPAFQKAINDKVIAEQHRLQTEKMKQTQLEAAKADAEIAKQEASAKVTQATAEAEAIKIQAQAIQQQGGVEYVKLQAIQKWDGHSMPQIVGADNVPSVVTAALIQK